MGPLHASAAQEQKGDTVVWKEWFQVFCQGFMISGFRDPGGCLWLDEGLILFLDWWVLAVEGSGLAVDNLATVEIDLPFVVENLAAVGLYLQLCEWSSCCEW